MASEWVSKNWFLPKNISIEYEHQFFQTGMFWRYIFDKYTSYILLFM